jgi:hypothetical protein
VSPHEFSLLSDQIQVPAILENLNNIFVLFLLLVYIALVIFPKLKNLRNMGYDLVKYFLKNCSFHLKTSANGPLGSRIFPVE